MIAALGVGARVEEVINPVSAGAGCSGVGFALGLVRDMRLG